MKVLLYFLRWQIAGLLLYSWTIPMLSKWVGIIVGNVVGASIFFYIDKYLTERN